MSRNPWNKRGIILKGLLFCRSRLWDFRVRNNFPQIVQQPSNVADAHQLNRCRLFNLLYQMNNNDNDSNSNNYNDDKTIQISSFVKWTTHDQLYSDCLLQAGESARCGYRRLDRNVWSFHDCKPKGNQFWFRFLFRLMMNPMEMTKRYVKNSLFVFQPILRDKGFFPHSSQVPQFGACTPAGFSFISINGNVEKWLLIVICCYTLGQNFTPQLLPLLTLSGGVSIDSNGACLVNQGNLFLFQVLH